jgi:hypothetical protein
MLRVAAFSQEREFDYRATGASVRTKAVARVLPLAG